MDDGDLLREVEAFVEVAGRMRVIGAAEALGVTRRTVGARLAALERRTGLQLVDRSHRRRIALTAAGEAALPGCRRLLEAMRAAHEDLAAVRAGAVGVVRVALISLSDPVLDGVVRALEEVDPRWQVVVRRMHRSTAQDSLRIGAVDCAIGARFAPPRTQHGFDPRPTRFEAIEAISVGRYGVPDHAVAWRTAWTGRHAERLVEVARELWVRDRRARDAARAERLNGRRGPAAVSL